MCSSSDKKETKLQCSSSDKKETKLVFSWKFIIIYEISRHSLQTTNLQFVNKKQKLHFARAKSFSLALRK
jgi:hypothetical protein